MSEAWIPALIAAIGAIAAAVIGVFGGRGRLHRLEALSRILKDLPQEDPAYVSLAEVLKDDAEELRRSRRSPESALLWLSAIAFLLLLVVTGYGEAIREWSSPVYVTLVLASLVTFFLLVVGLVTTTVFATIRLARSLIRRRREHRERSTDGVPSKAE